MFEKTLHFQSAFAPGIRALGKGDSQDRDSLRRIGWDELSARIVAARDLRRELHHMKDHCAPTQTHSDASSSDDLCANSEDEHSVNRNVLEERKAYTVINTQNEGGLSKGEKENIDD